MADTDDAPSPGELDPAVRTDALLGVMRPHGCEAQVVDPEADGRWMLVACNAPAQFVQGPGTYGHWLCPIHRQLMNPSL